MKKIITIGVAVYNVENYLNSCLDSVIKQKGEDVEMIVVDDGSTDKSGEICDRYAEKDARIKVIHKENGGVSTARNIIIEEAQGDWICFVDGDDMLTDDAVEIIRENLSTEYPIIFFDAVHFRNESSIPKYDVDMPSEELSGEKLNLFGLQTLYAGADAYDFVNKTAITPWGKIYSKAFILENALRFEPDARKGQDLIFSIYCIPYIEKTLLVRKPIYLYRINDASISNRHNTNIKEQINNFVRLLRNRIFDNEDKYGEEFARRCNARCIVCIKSTCELYFFHKNNNKPFKVREKEFLDYIAQQWCVDSINNCDVSLLTKRNRAVYGLIKNRDTKALSRYFKYRDVYGEAKSILNKVGIRKG